MIDQVRARVRVESDAAVLVIDSRVFTERVP
jgi:hypothetical protein